MPLASHDGDDLAGKIVPTKEVGLEYRAHGVSWNILKRARDRECPVVENRAEFSAIARKAFRNGVADRRAVRIVEHETFQSLTAQALAVFFLPAGGEYAPASLRQSMGGIITDARGASGY